LQEFRQKKLTKGNPAKTYDESKVPTEQVTSEQNDPDPDLELVTSVPLTQYECNEDSNTQDPASGRVEESRDGENIGLATDGLAMGEASSNVEPIDLGCPAEGVKQEKVDIDDGQ
ncbi:hypothetical protein KI387_001869, partial [Taxus chinensis]